MSSAGDRTQFIAITRPVAAGQVIAAADLRAVSAVNDAELGLVAAGQASEVVGRTAAVPLLPGTLLQPAMLGEAVFPARDRVVASLALKPGRYPQHLAAGASVSVFVSQSSPAEGGQSATVSPARVAAVVLGVDLAGDGQGATVVTLELARKDAAAVAGAPAESVMVMQIAPGGD
ncbi:MAG TPA: SAF domain-containing protein [Pilimelia sp.]|nr:SAF domain-containing protein [Pilimelia sp.]